MSEWISVENGLPDEQGYYNVVTKTGVVLEAWWFIDAKEWVFPNYSDGKEVEEHNPPVTHWMPLPEPPKEQP